MRLKNVALFNCNARTVSCSRFTISWSSISISSVGLPCGNMEGHAKSKTKPHKNIFFTRLPPFASSVFRPLADFRDVNNSAMGRGATLMLLDEVMFCSSTPPEAEQGYQSEDDDGLLLRGSQSSMRLPSGPIIQAKRP